MYINKDVKQNYFKMHGCQLDSTKFIYMFVYNLIYLYVFVCM